MAFRPDASELRIDRTFLHSCATLPAGLRGRREGRRVVALTIEEHRADAIHPSVREDTMEMRMPTRRTVLRTAALATTALATPFGRSTRATAPVFPKGT